MSSKRIGIILDVDAEVSKAKGNISSLSKVFDGIGGKQGNQLRSILADINTEYSKLADESGKAVSKIGDFSKAEKSLQKLDQLFGKLEKELGNIDKMSDSDLSKLFPPEVADRIKKASDAIKTYNTYVEESSKTKGAIGQATKQYEDQEKAVRKAAQALKELEDIQRGASKKQVVSADTKALKANEVKAAVAELNQYEKELVEAQSKMDEFKKRKADLFTRGTQNKSSEFRQLNQDLDAAQRNFDDAADKAGELKRELKNMVIQGDLDNDIKDAEKALENAQDAAEELKKNLDAVKATEFSKAFDEAKKKLEALSDVDLSNVVKIDDLNDLFKRFSEEGIEGVKKGVTEMKQKMEDLGNANKEAGNKVDGLNQDLKQQNEAFSEVQGIKNRVLEFFSLNNAMQLAQRAMQQTFQTIKELDKAMTETAVVTDFSVGDMWDALPRYTKAANELGTTTLGAYETMTLFYQQGLDTNEAFEVGTETMKMARIAGLEYAEATDLMTAALRGFNMELNETSAKRVNDVYSELAAITAADTEEIATAMTKTASIAKSANMEFETTAAFLSQIIETTREPAETAGTAMKTIIARFTEMKKATSDVFNFEGEEINVNKVEEALRSAGVALRDVNGEFRDTDDVFLELASKWDNLDIMTQRYIATMAAGSRQQSRFLAMMQDYDRTVELIDAAYNSSGASQAQFLKTQDSLESKLNKLKNAWNEFLMGITDSKAIKVGVDLLTGLLNIINKLTGNSGLGKLTVALGAILGGKMISNKVFGNIGSSIATQFLKPLADAGVLTDNVAQKIKGLGNGSLWQQVKNGVGAFVKGLTTAGSIAGALLPILLAVAAVLAVIGAAWYFSDEQVETRKLKEAQELAAGLAEGLEDAKNAVATIADDRSGLEALKKELNDLVAGTDEWRLKLLEVQAEENKLINKYNLSGVQGAIRIDSQGNQTITQSGWDYVEKRQSDAVSRQLTASQIANAAVNRQQFELEKVQRIEAAEDESSGKADEWIGGTIGTVAGTTLGAAGGLTGLGLGLGMAIKGALSGAAYGTIATPIVGTIVGALGGAIAGAAIGFGANELIEEIGHDDEYQKTVDQISREERIADQQQTMAYKNAFKSSMSNKEEFSDYSSEEIDALATVSAANIDKYIEAEQDAMKDGLFNLDGANKEEIKDWAENYKGYTYKDGKVYDVEGNEIDTSDNEAIAKELATFKAMEKTEKVAKTAATHLRDGGEAVEELGGDIARSDFAKMLSGDATASYDLVEQMLQGETADTVAQKILDGKAVGESETELIASLTGYTEKEIEKGLKKFDGNYKDYLSNILQNKAVETAENQEYMRKDFFEEALLSGYGRDNIFTRTSSGNIDTQISYDLDDTEFNSLTNMVKKLDAETLQTVTTVGTKLREAFKSSGVAGKIFFEALSGMDSSQVEEVASYLGNVDFSNPIKGAHAFQQALSSTKDEAIKTLITDLQEVSKTQYDVGSQFDYLMNSGIYEGLQESIAGIVEENGKLTADNIIELSGASEELSLMLEQDENMAESLAKAFTIVETQGLDAMQGITTATLKALGETRTLATMYDEMMTSIENFEPAIDTMSGIDFIGQSLETMKGMIDSGEYGNAQLHSYLQHFFGEGSTDSVDEIIGNYNKLTRWSKNEGRNFWTEASAAGALVGDSKETETISTTFKTGNLSSIKIAKGLTTEQALKQLQTSMHITEDAARDYLAVLTSHSLALANTLKANDAGAAVKTLVKTRQEQLGVEKGGVVSEDEVKTIAVAYDMDEETLTKLLEQEYEVTIVGSFTDEDGNPLTGDSLKAKFGSEEGQVELESVMVLDTEVAEEGFDAVVDYVETKEVLMDLGMTEAQANETIDNFIATHSGKVGIAVNGEVLPVTTAEAANNWANSMLSSITTDNLAIFVSQLAAVDFTPVITSIKNAIKKEKFSVNISPKTSEFIAKIGAAINSAFNSSAGTWGIPAAAKGSDGIPKNGPVLTGEEGMELVQSEDGTAHFVGVNGPEISNLRKGDKVYTAEETKKIIKGGPQKPFNRYAKGTHTSGSGRTHGGGGRDISTEKELTFWEKVTNGVLTLIGKAKNKEEQQTDKKKQTASDNKKQATPATKKQVSNPSLTSHIERGLGITPSNTTGNTPKKSSTNSTTPKKQTTTTNNKSNTEKIANNEEKIKNLERKKKKGQISETAFQKNITPILNDQHTLYGKEKQKAIDQSKGAIYYDKATDTIQYNTEKFNKLGDKDKETVRKLYDQAVQFNQHQNDIEDQIDSFKKQNDENDKKKREEDKKKQENAVEAGLQNNQEKLDNLDKKKESGELSYQEWRDAREPLLNNRQTLLDADYENKLAGTNGVIYEDKDGNLQYNMTKFNKLGADEQDDMEATFKELSSIDKEKKDIAKEVASYNKKGSTTTDGQTTNTFNLERQLEQLEEDYENGKYDAGTYQEEKGNILGTMYTRSAAEFENEYKNSEYKDYFDYDLETGKFALNETKYNAADKDIQEKVDAEGEHLGGLFDTAMDIKDQIGDLRPAGYENSTKNNEAILEAIDKKYSQGKMDSKEYSNYKRDTLQDQRTNLKGQLNEGLKSKNAGKYYDYDKTLGAILVNETEIAKLGEEEQKKVLEEIAALEQVNDELGDVEQAIKDAKKAVYDTKNARDTQDTLDRRFENGDIDPKTYQTQKKKANNAEDRKAKAENAKTLRDLDPGEIGQVYYDEISQSFKVNELYDFKSEAEKEAAQGIADSQTKQLTDILNMEKGEERTALLNQFRKDWYDSSYSGTYYLDEYGELRTDAMVYRKLDETARTNADQVVDDYNANVLVQYENDKENEDLTARKYPKGVNPETYDIQKYEYELEDIETQYQNGTLSHSQYVAKKETAMRNQQTAALNELAYQLNPDTSDYANLLPYIKTVTDANGNIIGVEGNAEGGYYELGDEAKGKVDTFIELLRGLCGTASDINSTLKDPMFTDSSAAEGGKTAETKRAEYNAADAALWNLAGDQENLAEDREDLSNLQGVLGKLPLPQEMQTALGMGFTAAGMGYEAQEIMQTRTNYNLLDDQRELRETESEYVGPAEQALSSDPEYAKVAAYWDSVDNVYKINEEKFNALSPEEQAKLLEDVKTFRDEFGNELNQLARAMDGGIIQDATEVLGKSLKDISKAFNKGEDGVYDTKEALRALEATLGLTEGTLGGFEDVLAQIAQGAEKVNFKGLGMSEEQLTPMTDFFKDKNLGGVGDLLSMVLGEGGFNGADLLGASTGAIGEMLEFGSGFMNWDMINGGVDMLTQGISLGQQVYDRIKQGIEKAKQMIEQVIQYIAQATQVLVDAWTNREDYLYNYLKLIEKHLKEYEELQRYSTQLEKGRLSSSQDILNNWNEQWKSLQLQLEEQTERLETRQQELDRSRWNPFSLISGWDPTSDTLYENREVKMLWDIIIGLGEAFAPLGTGQFFSQLNQLYEDYDQRVQQSYEDRLAAEQALLDIEDERLELVKVGADEATEFEEKLMEALIQKEQEAIDELSRLNDSVTEANQKLLSTLQSNLDKIRQDRENEKKEEELGEKERRLAYLRQDTSGANASEIRKLEKELEDEHEDYTDTLIDQKISELEKQNELAAEQRQKQIDLLQGQLDYAEKYGLYWDKIYGMLYTIDENGQAVLNSDNFDIDGNIRENSELAKLLGTFSDRMSMSTWSQVLDNEEAKRLGRYYGAFIGMNGVDGNWANYWALLDPGANDPNYSHPEQEIPDGLWGVLYKLEIGIKKYFGNSNLGLVNGAGRIDQGVKNFFGKLFGYDEWANYEFTGFEPAHVESTFFGGIKNTTDSIKSWFASGFENLTKGNKTSVSNEGTQNSEGWFRDLNINIDRLGESIDLDEMIDKVTTTIKGLFSPTGVVMGNKKH